MEDVRMAKEMGLNPRSLIKNIPSKSELWKGPVKYWLRHIYRERQEKAQMKKKRRAEKKEKLPEDAEAMTESEQPPEPSILHGDFLPVEGEESTPPEEEADDMAPIDYEFAKLELEEDDWDDYGPPSQKEIAEENRLMRRRHKEFQIAAEYVAAAFADLPEVQKVVLFGSVALPFCFFFQKKIAVDQFSVLL